MDVLYTFFSYFLSFMLYSFLGWGMEVILTYFNNRNFVNRGFLLGPYCPIYGYGMLLIVFLLRNCKNNVLVLFVLSMVICLVLEYLTSYFMELIFKVRWWDYSDKKYNINGRVCLEYGFFFGIGGTIIMYIVHPFVLGIVNKLTDIWLLVVGITLFIIFLVDNIISFDAMSKIRGFEFKKYKDSTEDITSMVREYLIKRSKLTKRLVGAFPDVNMKIKSIRK